MKSCTLPTAFANLLLSFCPRFGVTLPQVCPSKKSYKSSFINCFRSDYPLCNELIRPQILGPVEKLQVVIVCERFRHSPNFFSVAVLVTMGSESTFRTDIAVAMAKHHETAVRCYLMRRRN
jgi:hypothetical protein